MVAATVGVLLSACVSPQPAENSTPGPGPLPEQTETSSPGAETEKPATDDLEAVLVFASMDVDGAHLSISGYVTGIIDDGGVCTYTATPASGEPVSVTTEGVADRASTSCGLGQIPTPELSSGAWTASLTYQPRDPDRAPVTSEPETVEVP